MSDLLSLRHLRGEAGELGLAVVRGEHPRELRAERGELPLLRRDGLAPQPFS